MRINQVPTITSFNDPAFINFLNQLRQAGLLVAASGPTTTRPINAPIGTIYFDTTLVKVIVLTAANPDVWDLMGAVS